MRRPDAGRSDEVPRLFRADAAAAESAVAAPTTTATFTTPVTADGKIGQDVQVSCVVPIRPDQQEIQRRLELVRAMFNDFWSGCDDKPAAFVDRLDQAEPYLNERLTACGEACNSSCGISTEMVVRSSCCIQGPPGRFANGPINAGANWHSSFELALPQS